MDVGISEFVIPIKEVPTDTDLEGHPGDELHTMCENYRADVKKELSRLQSEIARAMELKEAEKELKIERLEWPLPMQSCRPPVRF